MLVLCTLNTADLFQGEHPEILAEIEVGYRKSGFRRIKARISLKRDEIALRLLLMTNRKSQSRFRLVPKSTSMDDFEGSLCTLFQHTCAIMLLFIYF